MTYGPDGQEQCECGFDLHQMMGVGGDDGFVCADCVTFYDNDGRRVGGPYRPPTDLLLEIDDALTRWNTDAMGDALNRVYRWLKQAMQINHPTVP